MRISGWSSDVCSSDLGLPVQRLALSELAGSPQYGAKIVAGPSYLQVVRAERLQAPRQHVAQHGLRIVVAALHPGPPRPAVQAFAHIRLARPVHVAPPLPPAPQQVARRLATDNGKA